ncbi:MAG: DivIVA domain-containing protein [Clostridia bacterium]|nr:DivIVA domain-containing protein [Clostridia bacterium]
MLTLKQITDVSFRKSNFSGYRPEDVDDFIDEVTESFTALLKENQAYKTRVNELQEKNADYKEKLITLAQTVEKYKKDEDGIKSALVTAQKLSNASLREAKQKSEAMISEATEQAEQIMAEANSKSIDLYNEYQLKIEAKEKELDALKKAVTEFRSEIFNMYREHLTLIEKIPDFSAELASKAEAQAAETVNEPEEVAEDETTALISDIKSEIANEEYVPDSVEDFNVNDEDTAGTKTFDAIDDIDLNAFSDIPEELKKEKESLYSTLAFGDDVDIKS